MIVEAGTVLAPEPVVTTQPLTGYNGASAAADYENSGPPTRVLRWTYTAGYAPWLAAGTPCALTALPVDVGGVLRHPRVRALPEVRLARTCRGGPGS
jgi:hypothetical protein